MEKEFHKGIARQRHEYQTSTWADIHQALLSNVSVLADCKVPFWGMSPLLFRSPLKTIFIFELTNETFSTFKLSLSRQKED